MPRKRQTQTGAPALPVQSVPGRRYGEGVESAALQRALPAPAAAVPSSAAPGASGTPTTPAGAPGAAPSPETVDRFTQALNAAQGVQGAGLLDRPTAYPDRPVTNGMIQGPGAGPEAIPPLGGSPTGRYFRELARITGDRYIAELADRAGL